MRKINQFLRYSAAVAGAILLLSGTASARDLTVVGWGGALQEQLRINFFDPYSKEIGKPVLEDSWDGGIGILRTKTANGDGGWDVVQVESEELELGCQEGLFLKLDVAAIANPDDFLPGNVHECGIGAGSYNFVLGFDKKDGNVAPGGWADFFDLQKFPGKRALRQGPKGNLEIALMADGVAPADVYSLLATPEGVDRAFQKLDSIKAALVFWKTGSQPAQMMAAGDVAMSSSYHSGLVNAIRKDKLPFGIVWKQSLTTTDSWVILTTTPNTQEAYGLLKVMTNPDAQARLSSFQPIGVSMKSAVDKVDPETAPYLPTFPDNAKNVLTLNASFWIDHIDTLTERWTAWAGQ